MNPSGSAKTPTPEERLLRLIRGKGQEAKTKPPAAAPTGQVAAAAEFVEARPSVQWPRALSAVLALIVVAEVALLVFLWFRPAALVDLSSLGTEAAAEPEVLPELRAVLGAYAQRSIFAEPLARVAAPAASNVAAPSIEASKLAARLSLLGIVAGETPQAIIEDSQTQKSYFVTEGQTVVDGAVVESVNTNGVILNFLGETIELNL